MSRKTAVIALLLWSVLVLTGRAFADESPLFAQVSEQVRRALPVGLGLVRLSLPEGAHGDFLRVSWPSAPREGWNSVQIEVSDKSARKLWARAELRELRPSLVAARPLVVGQLLLEGDLVLAAKPRAEGEGLDLSPQSLLGKTILTPLAAGELLSAQSLELPAPLAAGSSVTARVSRGGLQISAAAVLEKAARPGEACAVRLSSGRLVKGRLIDAETFSVEEAK
jgi:flagella basal body P-ring formation protein FlgA